MRRVYRRRRAAAGLLVLAFAAVLLVVESGGGDDAQDPVAAEDAEPALQELPGGGRELFPERRIVGFFGAPQDERLGELGIGTPAEAGRRLLDQAKPYETEERPVLPAFELIATIADPFPGEDGLYRTRQKKSVIREYLEAAREFDALLVLDIQPGQADFLSEAKVLRRFLEEPDVGLALDPEWRMATGEVPGQSIGSVEAAEIGRVARYLSGIVEENGLPEKMLLVHQFTPEMILNREELEAPPGVALTMNVDGVGGADVKRRKYHELVRLDSVRPRSGGAGPEGGRRSGGGRFAREPDLTFPVGFKLFYEEDTDLLGPEQVLDLSPPPDVVVYE
jgi:hypothetical protein